MNKPREAEFQCGNIEAELEDELVTIAELGTESLHVMMNLEEAAALRDWLKAVLP